MSVIVPKTARTGMLDDIKDGRLQGASLCLFRNNLTPDANTVLGDLTEANFSGYARQTLSAWPNSALSGAIARTTHPDKTFLHSGGGVDNDIYGYYVLDSGGGLLYADRNATGPVSITPGTGYFCRPIFDLTQ